MNFILLVCFPLLKKPQENPFEAVMLPPVFHRIGKNERMEISDKCISFERGEKNLAVRPGFCVRSFIQEKCKFYQGEMGRQRGDEFPVLIGNDPDVNYDCDNILFPDKTVGKFFSCRTIMNF